MNGSAETARTEALQRLEAARQRRPAVERAADEFAAWITEALRGGRA